MPLSPEQKARKAITMKAWRERNKDHVRAYKELKGKEQSAVYREKHRESLRKKHKDYYEKNKDLINERVRSRRASLSKEEREAKYKELYTKRKKECNEASKKYRLQNIEKTKKMISDWKKRNSHKVRASSMKRLSAKYRAIPKWVDMDAIEDVYKEAAYMQLQVDHIVPLQSKIVCGLHVWDNLQLLSKEKNILKSNKWWPDMPEKIAA